MLNYIKSEFYRITHTTTIYAATGILTALVVAMNVVLVGCSKTFVQGGSFPYATSSFSLSMLVSSPTIYLCMGVIIVAILYEMDKRNGNLKNTIACGISRTKIFAGKCVVSFVTSAIVAVMVLAAYIGSAMLLLEQTGPVQTGDVLMETLAVLLPAAAALILGVLVLELFEKSVEGMIVWFLVIVLIPNVFFYMGFEIELFRRIALWMPVIFFKTDMIVNTSQCVTVWDSAAGLAKCIISGAVGSVVFGLAGIILLRKRDL